MSTVLPEGQNLRKAVQWISDTLLQNPDKNKMQLVNDACLKFGLNPKESNQLMQFYLEKNK